MEAFGFHPESHGALLQDAGQGGDGRITWRKITVLLGCTGARLEAIAGAWLEESMVERKKGVLWWGKRGVDGSGGEDEKVELRRLDEGGQGKRFCTRTGMKFQLGR